MSDDSGAGGGKRQRVSQHLQRIRGRCGDALSLADPHINELFDRKLIGPAASDHVLLHGRTCRGLSIHRGATWCSPAQAAAVYAELDSVEAQRLSWTALRDGGNPDSLSDTTKVYCGELPEMLARGGRYRQQLLVRGRRAEPLLLHPAITTVRAHAFAAAEAAIEPALLPLSRLTEQLIRYLPSDRWFAPHWDKDRRDKSHKPLDPKAFDGPGDVLATLCLGCTCTLLMLPRGGRAGAFAVELEPGDIYVLSGDARWEWKHGISVVDDEMLARRAIVWRFLADGADT
jgi:hypothetical protein